METSLNSYLANSSPFKSDIGSLRGKIECLDTQRAGEVDFFKFKVLSDCCLDGRCWASSQVEIMAPTMLNAEMLNLDSMLLGGPGVSKCPEKDRDNEHEEALSPRKGSDTWAQTRTDPHVPSHSEDESSHLILINTAQNVYE